MVDDSKERKASEVLAEVEGKIDKLLALTTALSFDVRNLLERAKIARHVLPPLSASDNKSMAVVSPVQETPNIVVTNAMAYSDKKPIRLGKIEVFDSNNKLVVKTLTNHVGKWTATLKPGVYSVSLSKGATADKIAVTYSYTINITPDSPQRELPLVIV